MGLEERILEIMKRFGANTRERIGVALPRVHPDAIDIKLAKLLQSGELVGHLRGEISLPLDGAITCPEVVASDTAPEPSRDYLAHQHYDRGRVPPQPDPPAREPVKERSMATKTCNECGQAKSTSEFNRNHAAKDGLSGKCKPCLKAYQIEWRKKNKGAPVKNPRANGPTAIMQPPKRKAAAAKKNGADGELLAPATHEIVGHTVHLGDRVQFLQLSTRRPGEKEPDQVLRLDLEQARQVHAWLGKQLAA